jgi:DNA primase
MNDKRKIVTDILGSYRRSGDEHLYSCPFCKHHKKKMSVNFSINSFKCWVCDARGKNIYRLVRKFGNYKQRQKYLELQGRLDLTEFEDIFRELNEVEEKQKIDLPVEFVSLCNKRLPKRSQAPLEYLRKRGIEQSEILKWKMGYCSTGRYSGRIIIPSIDSDGDCNYFIARSYVGHGRKYLNPPCGRDIIFNELMIDWNEPIVLVEGVFDSIVAGDNSIPLLGSTLREDSRLFQALAIHDTPVYLALDPDAEKKAQWIIKSMMKYDLEVKRVVFEDYEDIGSMTKEVYHEKLRMAEEVDSDFYFLEKQLRSIWRH